MPNGSVTQLRTFLINSIFKNINFLREEFASEYFFCPINSALDIMINCLFFLHVSSTKNCDGSPISVSYFFAKNQLSNALALMIIILVQLNGGRNMAGGAVCECNVEVSRQQLFCKNSRAASRDTVDSQNYTYVYEEINLCETHN